MSVFYISSLIIVWKRIGEMIRAGGIPRTWTLWHPRIHFKNKAHLAWCYILSDIRSLKRTCASIRENRRGTAGKSGVSAVGLMIFLWSVSTPGSLVLGVENSAYREPYRVQVGDVLDIHPEKSSSELYPVLPDGNLYIPAIGTDMVLNVLDKTTVEIANEIKKKQNMEIPVNYVVIVKSRSQSEVRVLGAATIVGEQPADNLLKIIARAGGGTRAWNKKIRVYYPDERKMRIYKVDDILNQNYSAPDIPRESTVVFCEKWTYTVFGSWREVLPWLVLASGIYFGVSR